MCQITCPTCDSTNVRSIDNESLYHPTKREVELGVPKFDNKIYVSFICQNCNPNGGRAFKKVFILTPED